MAVKKTSETTASKSATPQTAASGTLSKSKAAATAEAFVNPKMSYTKAFDELQKIVAELESEEVEIDALVARLQRAGVLLQICKSRLSATEVETEKLLSEIVE